MELDFIRKFRHVLRKFDREIFFQNNSSCCNGITLAQCHNLLEIEQNENITVTELANNLSLDKSTISRTVDGLVNIGLVDRNIPSDNRRTSTLNLTENGKKTCQNINYNNDKYIENTLHNLDATEQKELLRLLEKITQNMIELRKRSDSHK